MKTNIIRSIFSIYNNERGLVAPISLIIMAVMFFIVGSFASMLTNETREAAKLRRRIQAFHIAEGAMDRAVYQINQDPSWRAGWSNVSLGAGTYTVTLTDVDSSRLKVVATATVDSITRKVSTYLTKATLTPVFNYAAYGREKSTINDKSGNYPRLGSYNSSVGTGLPPVDFSLANSDADIATNSTNKKSIDVSGTSTIVKGDAVIGVGGNPADIQDATKITGTKSVATTTTNFVTVQLPSAYTYIDQITTTTTLAAGNYVVNKIDLKNTSILTTTGPVKIYIGESLKLSDNAIIKAGSSKPADLAIYGLNEMTNADLDIVGMEKYQATGNSLFYGVLYAPKANISISGSSGGAGVVAAGAFMGKTVRIDGNTTIYYDEALKNNGAPQTTSIAASRTGSWEGDF